MPVIDGLFELADQDHEDRLPGQTDIDLVFEGYVVPMGRGEQVAGN